MLLISDTNIFIDLDKIDLLRYFDKLDIKIATSDFVYNELLPQQREKVDHLDIDIYEMTDIELSDFYIEFFKLNLKKISYQDYSIFYYAKKYDGEILSNDKRLREFTRKRSIKIKGIFFILDEIVNHQIVNKEMMVKKLIQLKKINPRVKVGEVDARIKRWGL